MNGLKSVNPAVAFIYFIMANIIAMFNINPVTALMSFRGEDGGFATALDREGKPEESNVLATRQAENPLQAFCEACRPFGYEIYPMELVEAGEEFYAAYRRSTNGGGENSPKLKGEDDFYEMFFCILEAEEAKLR